MTHHSETIGLTPLGADDDDGTITIRWRRHDGRTVALSCYPDGNLVRIVSPMDDRNRPLQTHVERLQ